MENVKLNFINRSYDSTPKNIVIYQSNEASMSHDEVPIAWKVIENCGMNESHSLEFNSLVEVAMGDSFGNYGESIEARAGRTLEAIDGHFGGELKFSDKMTHNPFEFAVLNKLKGGSITVNCFRDGKLLATRDHVYQGEPVTFRFSERISVAVVPGVEEGEELDTSILEEIEVQFDLGGIGSADIIITGGGEGDNAVPLEFSMTNIKGKSFQAQSSFSSWFKAD